MFKRAVERAQYLLPPLTRAERVRSTHQLSNGEPQNILKYKQSFLFLILKKL